MTADARSEFDRDELDARAATVPLGVAIALGLSLMTALYALETWSRPNRVAILGLLSIAVIIGAVLTKVGAQRIVRWRHRELFFVLWSAGYVVIITGLVMLDGGMGSPTRALWFVPMVFAALSYPVRSVLVVSGLTVIGFGIALTTDTNAHPGSFVALASLLTVAWLGLVQTRRQIARRQALATLSRDYELILSSAGEGVLRLDAHGRAVFANPAAAAILRTTQEQILGCDVHAVFHHHHPDGTPFPVETCPIRVNLMSGGIAEATIDHFWRADGTIVPVSYTTAPVIENGRVTGAVVTFADVSERERLTDDLRRSREDLQHQSLHDPLTGLPNRLLLHERLQQGLDRAAAADRTLALLFLDLDDFKRVNDLHGHETGDRLLVMLSERLRERMRSDDTLARFGGDEFIVLCEGVEDPAYARDLAARIVAACEEPFTLAGHRLVVSGCVGIAIAQPGSAVAAEALIRDADTAMYDAKRAGRGCITVFDDRLRAQIVAQAQMEHDLSAALAAGQLSLAFQPILSMADGRVSRMETLARWTRPDGTSVAPSEFIAVAERSGLITSLGTWVLREACHQAARWRREARHPGLAEVRLSVNASASQVADPAFPQTVAATLAEAGLPADALVIEITETTLVADPDTTEKVLEELSELGVRVVLDDFGTGYSSLTSLQRFPLTGIKLDRSYVAELGRSPRGLAIVRGLVVMARELGLATCGEGVEREDQLLLLRELGCDLAQGYLLARPLPAGEIEGALRAIEAEHGCAAGAPAAQAPALVAV